MSKPLWRRVRDGVRWRSRPLLGWSQHRVWKRLVPLRPERPLLLHIGSGMERLDGWINIDIQTLPEVDLALDVRQGLPLSDVEAVFAEHFLEHLEVLEALDFLTEVHRALAPRAWLRLSTPNLDWVLSVHQRREESAQDQARRAIAANRGFYGWGHRFVWNRELLLAALAACGFSEARFCRYGESILEVFRGLERHETYEDIEQCPHVLIVEARKGESVDRQNLADLKQTLEHDFLRYLEP